MAGASIETTLELFASSLRDVKARIRRLFTQERVAASANLFLDGLLGDERRKTGWMRAEAAGDSGPWRQQAILGRGRWDIETRSWHGWHRHVSLVMLAFAMMAVIRYRANDATPPKRPRIPTIRS
jgi:SRSO17 transposase